MADSRAAASSAASRCGSPRRSRRGWRDCRCGPSRATRRTKSHEDAMRHHAKGTSSGDAGPSQEVLPTLAGASSKTKSPEIQRSSVGTELARAFELYGSLKEGVHVAGYTLERAWNHLECLLEEDRWKAVGFDNINTFLDSIQLHS